MGRYRKKPVEIEAIQFIAQNIQEVYEMLGDNLIVTPTADGEGLYHFIRTLEGDMEISWNDYIIKGVKGEFYPCKPDIFELTYDKIKFEGHLKLLKGNLNSKESSYVGDSIPYKFLDIKSFSNMYYMPKSKKMVVYNSYFNKKDISEFTIYSISFPVIPITKNNTKPINSLFWYVSIFGIIGILAIGSFIYFKRIKKTKKLL